jgi:NAD-dependent dihydropyrimidine dehydrogenase PreA subunit
MSVRKIIAIDESGCSGCGLCIPNCPEGALQIIDGKARLVSDLFCDGLGACIGYCPEGAITVAEREAEPYDETRVMAGIARQGANTIRAHLDHLRMHGEERLLGQALAWLAENRVPSPAEPGPAAASECCGQKAARLASPPARETAQVSRPQAPPGRPDAAPAASHLSNWPVQLHLLSPMAPSFRGKDVLLSADCVAFSMGNFHQSLLDGRALAIACPKLDDGADIYREKITALIDHAQAASLTVAVMEVPCCRGLVKIVQEARAKSHRSLPVSVLTVGIRDGAVLSEESI